MINSSPLSFPAKADSPLTQSFLPDLVKIKLQSDYHTVKYLIHFVLKKRPIV